MRMWARKPRRKPAARTPWAIGALALALVASLAACGDGAPSLPLLPTATKPVTPTATPLPTTPPLPTSTPAPTATATATPVPTPDPATLQASASAGLARVRAQAGEADLVCLRHEDTDADGAPEWVALAHQSVEPGRLSAFVLDEGAAYTLEPAHPKPGVPAVGLGQYPTCEVQIRDVNADGQVEIAIFGHAQDNETLLHLFVWDGGTYRRLGFFSGDAGVRFVDKDGDLEEEIWEGYRVREAPSLAWIVIHTWEEGTYGWTSDRYDWYFRNRPHSYPTHKPEYAVVAFYLALNERDLPGAHALLVPQPERGYEAWALGYATTVRVSVGGAHAIPGTVSESRARVAAMVTAWDNEGGDIVGRLWNTEWSTTLTPEGWRLDSATAELLDEWIVDYWE